MLICCQVGLNRKWGDSGDHQEWDKCGTSVEKPIKDTKVQLEQHREWLQ